MDLTAIPRLGGMSGEFPALTPLLPQCQGQPINPSRKLFGAICKKSELDYKSWMRWYNVNHLQCEPSVWVEQWWVLLKIL